MDLCIFLSVKENYDKLIKMGMQEVLRRTGCSWEDAEDIASQSLCNLLDYYQRKPEKLLELEKKGYKEMQNYLNKSIKNQIMNVIIKKYKKRKRELEIAEKIRKNSQNTFQSALQFPEQTLNRTLFINKDMVGKLTGNTRKLTKEVIRKDIYSFIESRFKPEKWKIKKQAISLYIKRMETAKTIAQMQILMPEKNLPSLNTQAHRIISSYRNWLNEKGRLDRFENEN